MLALLYFLQMGIKLAICYFIHQVKAVKGILRIGHPPCPISRHTILFNISAGKRRPAKQYRD